MNARPAHGSELRPKAAAGGPDFIVDPFRRLYVVVKLTVQTFFSESLSRLGAALAFYTTVAVAPLLVVTIAWAGLFFEESAAREKVLQEVGNLAGPQAVAAVATVAHPADTKGGVWATIVSSITLLFGAMGVFHHLQGALNTIWHVPDEPYQGWVYFIRKRLLSLATVLSTGFILLVSLVVSTFLTWASGQLFNRWKIPPEVLEATNILISTLIVAVLFAVIFRLLPDRKVRWSNVILGAGVTAILFAIGKAALGVYLARINVGTTYGAAGSFVALLIWCYYAAQIVFFGVELTRVVTLTEKGRNPAGLVEKPEPPMRTH